jgi:hypothetical protein
MKKAVSIVLFEIAGRGAAGEGTNLAKKCQFFLTGCDGHFLSK